LYGFNVRVLFKSSYVCNSVVISYSFPFCPWSEILHCIYVFTCSNKGLYCLRQNSVHTRISQGSARSLPTVHSSEQNQFCICLYSLVASGISKRISLGSTYCLFIFSKVIFPDIIYMQKLSLNIYLGKVITMT
jgi:hypothetical protein